MSQSQKHITSKIFDLRNRRRFHQKKGDAVRVALKVK